MQPLNERLNYHPNPQHGPKERFLPAFRSDSHTRGVSQRLRAILQEIDFHDKLVADLGCSGGFFSFKIADMAKHVWAIDADAQVIERNRKLAAELGYGNITFVCAHVSAETISSLPQTDVTLFLSVFHHMMTASSAYDWNLPEDVVRAMEIFPALGQQTRTLVFEMGYPNEGYEWCKRLPPMVPSPQMWVSDILRQSFDEVKIMPPPAYSGLRGKIHRVVSRQLTKEPQIFGRIARRLFSLDPRDARDVFVARQPQ